MGIRHRVRLSVEKALGVGIIQPSAHGHRDCVDVTRSGCRISVVFDVGAHIGESSLKFSEAFPQASVHAFEPASETFAVLQKTVRPRPRVTCHHMAVGSRDERATFFLTGQSCTNSLTRPDTFVGSEVVEVRALDPFCRENQIERIDLLKIDAEGADLEVLKGAATLLSSRRVAFVLAEVGFHPGDARHVLFDDIRSYLIPMGFSVFGIYDQQLEWSGEQRLRYANACFSNQAAFI